MLVNIGALGGMHGYWQCAEKYLKMIGFEPDERSFSKLTQSDSTKYLRIGLYKEKTLLDLYLTKKEGCTSILKPNRTFLNRFANEKGFDILGTVTIECDTLDSQFRKHQIKDVDFGDLDTQGSELFILEGATETLNSMFGLEIEVEFVPVYQDQPLFADIDRFIREKGFQLFDLRPYYWKRSVGLNYGYPKGQLIFADALYLRTPESFGETLKQIHDDELKKSKVLRALSICFLYGYFDYALEIFNSSNTLFDEDEMELVIEKIRNGVTGFAGKIPNFRGRGRIANLFHTLWKIFQPNSQSGIIRGELGAAEVD